MEHASEIGLSRQVLDRGTKDTIRLLSSSTKLPPLFPEAHSPTALHTRSFILPAKATAIARLEKPRMGRMLIFKALQVPVQKCSTASARLKCSTAGRTHDPKAVPCPLAMVRCVVLYNDWSAPSPLACTHFLVWPVSITAGTS